MGLSAKIIPLGILHSALFCLLVYIPVFLLCRSFAPFLLPFIMPLCLVLFSVLIYSTLMLYKTFYWDLEEDIITVKKGFFVRRHRRVRLKLAQSVKILSTPLMRLSKLCVLVIVFEGSILVLPLINHTLARKISETIGATCHETV